MQKYTKIQKQAAERKKRYQQELHGGITKRPPRLNRGGRFLVFIDFLEIIVFLDFLELP